MVPTIASGALRKMLAYCGDFGVAPEALLAAIDVDAATVADPDARVPIAKVHAAWETLIARIPRDDGALLCAERYTPGDYGLVGFVVMTSATFRDALGQLVRYIGLWCDDPEFSYDGPILRVAYRYPFPDGPARRVATEAAFTEIVQGARLVSGMHLVPRAVRFAHPPPRDPSRHAAFFGCDVQFDAGANELELRDEDLDLPLPHANPQLAAFLRDAANQALASREGDADSPLERARSIVAEELARSVPSVDTVARKMAISSRTLRRRLAEHGTSFRELLDDTRARLARGYVRDRRIPLAEVAFLLGFSETSTFHRAFKRWTNTTPAAWRAAPR